jgi:glycolate oxidase
MKDYIKELIKKLGKRKIHTEEEYLITYSFDAMRKKFLPEVIVFPEKTEDIVKIVNISSKYDIPITLRGAGTGQTGGALPVKGGILISFTKMDKILEINTTNGTAIVEPGVITYDFQKAVEKTGLFYPPDPASLKTSTIGGNVAENAGGPRCFKYGVTKNYILGLEAVLMDGEIIRTGGKTIKNVVGYNLTDILTGSEGTLAIISKIILKLIPKPESRAVARIGFENLSDAVKGVTKIITNGLFPSALEFMDKSAIEEVNNVFPFNFPEQTKAFLILEFDGIREEIATQLLKLKNLFSNEKITEIISSDKKEEMEKIWEIRRNISGAISKSNLIKINEDIVVPRDKLVDTVNFVYSLGKKYGIKTIQFGHIADGNIHTNFMITEEQQNIVKTILIKLFDFVVNSGGVLSGEHGIGIAKKPYIPLQLSAREIRLQKDIKKVFDPRNLLNPDKIF